MSRRNYIRLAILGFAVLLTMLVVQVQPAMGQMQYTAALSGTIVDPQGNPVSGAKVRLTSPERASLASTRPKAAGRICFHSYHRQSIRCRRQLQDSSITSKPESALQPVKLRRRTSV